MADSTSGPYEHQPASRDPDVEALLDYGFRPVAWLPPFMMKRTSAAIEQYRPMINRSPMKSK